MITTNFKEAIMSFKRSFINTLGGFATFLGSDYPKLEKEVLLEKAKELTGFDDFGNDSFKEGLSKLVISVKQEAKLSTIGKFSFYHESINLLSSRLALYNELKICPSTFTEEIKKPLIILGLPRTGSTILQTLLAQDPQFRTPLAWEYNLAPSPPRLEKYKNQNRIEKVKKGIEDFKSIVPELDRIHPLEAELPQECTMGMALNFDSILFNLKYRVPSYQKWYDNHDKSQTYREHKMILQYFQKNIPTKKWLLKNPAHIGALPEIFEVYPDAQIVQTHRDVKKTITSTASLYFHFRKAFGNNVKKETIAKEIIDIWVHRLNKGLDYRSQHPKKEERFFDFDFADFMDNPLQTIKNLYAYFDWRLCEETQEKMMTFLAENHRTKKGAHLYSLENYQLTGSYIESIFQDYSNRFIAEHKNYS